MVLYFIQIATVSHYAATSVAVGFSVIFNFSFKRETSFSDFTFSLISSFER